jgi:hypothetical protein
MPYYKHRKIELTPRRQADGTWDCPYRIIEFRQTCWAYHQGRPDGLFASREDATRAALREAKRLVDSLDPHAQGEQFESGSMGRAKPTGANRLTSFLPKSQAIFDAIKTLSWPGMAQRKRKRD